MRDGAAACGCCTHQAQVEKDVCAGLRDGVVLLVGVLASAQVEKGAGVCVGFAWWRDALVGGVLVQAVEKGAGAGAGFVGQRDAYAVEVGSAGGVQAQARSGSVRCR